MCRSKQRELIPFDPEIERTLKSNRKSRLTSSNSQGKEHNTQQVPMEDIPRQPNRPAPRPLKELGTPGAYRASSGIAPPTTEANDFEIRPAMITLIERRQFSGAKHESPLAHLNEFEKYCNTIKVNGVNQEFVRLKLFPFSLIGRALEWLEKEVKPNSLHTWDDVTTAFLGRFYSQKKTADARALIQGFRQRSGESIYEAWERYKEYQRECPHHGIPTYQVLQIFYGGLSPQGKTSLDAGAGCPIMNKTEEQVIYIIEDVVRHHMD